MSSVRIVRIIVVSPGDVQAERDTLNPIIDEINHGIAADRGLRLEIIRWETDTHPGFHPEGPQGLIDSILNIEDADLIVGIFWKRFGTPTKDAESGTEHELNKAYKGWKVNGRPQIMIYFNHKPYAPTTREELEQWMKVIEFRDAFPKEGLWWPYNGEVEFEKLVRGHLIQFIRRQFPIEARAGVEVKVVQTPAHDTHSSDISDDVKAVANPSDPSYVLLIAVGNAIIIKVRQRIETGETMQLTFSLSDPSDTAFLADLRKGRQDAIQVAYDNRAVLARVKSLTSIFEGGEEVYELELTISDNDHRGRGLGEMAFNNYSADQIAEMRVRRILLNESSPEYSKSDDKMLNTLNSSMLETFVRGLNTTIRIEESPFRAIYASCNGDIPEFLIAARLFAVRDLVFSGAVEHILTLELSMKGESELAVRFKGRRARTYANVEPQIIEVDGSCKLSDT